jgi:beta-galactosidase
MNETIRKYHNFFEHSRPFESKISLLLSPESMRILLRKERTSVEGLDGEGHMRSLLMWFVALQEMGYQVDIRYIRDYEWESNEPGRMAILANCISIPKDLVPAMEKFVATGNRLIAEGLTGYFDEYENCTYIKGSPLENLFGGRVMDIQYRETPLMPKLDFLPEPTPAFIWQPYIKPLTGDPVGKISGDTFAIRNRFGKGEVLWIPPCFSLAALPNKTGPLAALAGAELNGYLEEQPFAFARHTPGAQMRILRSGDSYLTVILNNRRSPVDIELVNHTKLKPVTIFGPSGAAGNKSFTLQDRETLVLLWE